MHRVEGNQKQQDTITHHKLSDKLFLHISKLFGKQHKTGSQYSGSNTLVSYTSSRRAINIYMDKHFRTFCIFRTEKAKKF